MLPKAELEALKQTPGVAILQAASNGRECRIVTDTPREIPAKARRVAAGSR
ncbi:MAG: hypothetical protein RIE24_05880 [Silicimonas sp.]